MVLFVCLAEGGCAKDPGDPPAGEAKSDQPDPANLREAQDEASPAKQSDDAYTPTLPSVSLEAAASGYELLAVGSEPVQRLRLVPAAGQVENIALTMGLRMQITGPGIAPIVQNLPPLRQINSAQTISVGEGRIEAKIVSERFAVDGAGANSQMAAMMQASIEQIRGFEQRLVFDDRGAVIEGALAIPEGANLQLAQTFETMRQTFEQVLVQFPEPGVGIGASWRETRALANNGIELEQTSQFELVAREGDALTLEMQSSQRPLTDKFTPPDKPDGEVSLLQFDSRGGGRVVYELAKLMPMFVHTKTMTEFTIEASIGGRTQQLTTKIDIELKLERLD
ncbi:hypothetical protein DB30_00681 [Enhygromyxa salina]|uniref:Uncharacterized protein n=1 Tax=Enhygromyxa salina TaxID=215803 RepID=A0A0C2D5F1_9BACT|nr:hypothetical protein DB30_00681 [Enhygromyxa salina]